MRQKDFDYWADILKSHFPEHRLVGKLGNEFRPNSQVISTKLRNEWRAWMDRVGRRMIAIRVDMEDWLDRRLPKKQDHGKERRPFHLPQPVKHDPNSVSIFVSFSHFPDDSSLVFKLQDYLHARFAKSRRVVEVPASSKIRYYESAVRIWCDRTVTTGTRWQNELDETQFRLANFILLMVSPDYLASDYCRRQMNGAEAREQAGSTRVIPVILHPVDWQPPAHWEPLPKNAPSVTDCSNQDVAFEEIAEGLLQAIPAEVQREWVDDPFEEGELREGPQGS
jgi:hypothetical protein